MFLPHSDVLEELFGLSGKKFVEEIIKIWHELSFGHGDAFEALVQFDEDAYRALEKKISGKTNLSEHDLPTVNGPSNKRKCLGRPS